MKTTKKDCKNKHRINIDSYLMKERIQRENMTKIDTKLCLKEIKRNSKNIKKTNVTRKKKKLSIM